MHKKFRLFCLSLSFIFVCFSFSCNSGGGGNTNTDTILSITQISPESADIGDTDFFITVYGTGFGPDSIVYWDGIHNCPTTFVSDTQLTMTLPDQDYIYPGDNNIHVNNRTNGDRSNTVSFYFEDGWSYWGTPAVGGHRYNDVHQILVDSEDPQIIYVVIYLTGLFITRDGGSSWEQAVTGRGPVAQDPENPDRLFFGGSNEVYVSIDRGVTWELIHTLDEESYIETIMFSKFYPNTIYISAGGSYVMFHRSQDDGVSWQSYSYGQTVGLDNFIPWTVAEDPFDGTLYSGVELGRHEEPYYPPFLRSRDGGETWENLVEGITSSDEGPTWHVVSIAVNPDNGKVYAATEGKGIYNSIDQGLTWTRTPVRGVIIRLIQDPWQADRLFGGALFRDGIAITGGVYISTDDGENYYKSGLMGRTITSLSFSGDGKILYAGTVRSGIYYKVIR